MRYTYPLPAQLDHHALAAHIRAVGVPGFTDGVSARIDTGELHIDLLPDAEPLTDEQEQALADAVASYVYEEPYDYAALRVAEYDKRIPIGQQLDALAKGLDSPEWASVVSERAAIKLEIPKQRPADW